MFLKPVNFILWASGVGQNIPNEVPISLFVDGIPLLGKQCKIISVCVIHT